MKFRQQVDVCVFTNKTPKCEKIGKNVLVFWDWNHPFPPNFVSGGFLNHVPQLSSVLSSQPSAICAEISSVLTPLGQRFRVQIFVEKIFAVDISSPSPEDPPCEIRVITS